MESTKPNAPVVDLRPLCEAGYEAYLKAAIAGYAEEKVKAGNWTAAEAPERARANYEQLLPQGTSTPNNTLLTIFEPATGREIGIVWYAIAQDGRAETDAFLYDFELVPEVRGKGFGRAALVALDVRLRGQGITSLALHVFGHNTVARALYETSGFEVTNLNMRKRL